MCIESILHSYICVIEYRGDDQFIPKNTQVSVKRIAVPSGHTGLLERIKQSDNKYIRPMDGSSLMTAIPAKDLLPAAIQVPSAVSDAPKEPLDEMAALREMTKASDYMLVNLHIHLNMIYNSLLYHFVCYNYHVVFYKGN